MLLPPKSITMKSSSLWKPQPSRRCTLIARNKTFIKEKGFEHANDFFMKDIPTKGWKELCKPPKPTTISIVRELYANLVDQGVKRVWVRDKWVPFDNDTINAFYNLP